MALTPDLRLAERALDELESREARCLVWGLVDNALSDDEVIEALRAVLQDPDSDALTSHPDCSIQTARDLRDKLIELRMLFRVPFVAGPDRWRTRMAEGVRLIAQLRQLFPKHERQDKWAEAATLVADYRFLRRPRRYPKRDCNAAAVEAALREAVGSPTLIAAVKVWLDQMDANSGLARFQVASSERILRNLEAGGCTGTLVSAGTGSGKTLAFYLPALSWLASQRVQSPSGRAVRVLALYPRNELLKDQLSEVYGQCRKFDSWILQHRGRPLRVGVLYGDTPTTAKKALEMHSWAKHPRGRRAPFFNCIRDHQHGEMVLQREDVDQSIERLVCPTCGSVVDSNKLAFTRQSIQADPPDILFTSVEMLNRHLPNGDLRHLFGVGPLAERAPDLVLLDEVHLYAGSYGAQVAYLLRRWWSASGRRSSFVGLSATIADGHAFFANLTGMSEGAVEEIKPSEEDIVNEGAEYMLALRGDPVSQTALLSTTIQTLMLASRLLDRETTFQPKTRPFYGWRAFAFTDQLDATNRLFMDLLDAEGRYADGRANQIRYPDGGLARLRAGNDPPVANRKFLAGQDWSIPRSIGHVLNDRLSVGRTTALDTGVSGHSEVVVATSALEVGFDDPGVGLVLQHKAPRDIASFLQRKGRAGRTRHMRPWTVAVLSDYGRDRLAYQAYDQMFEPELPVRQLPLGNRYVQRMQAVYALLDELGDWTHGDQPPLVVWRDLAYPNLDPIQLGWSRNSFAAVKNLGSNLKIPLTREKWYELQSTAKRLGQGLPERVKYAGVNWLTKRLQHERVVQLLMAVLEDPDKSAQLARRIGDRLALTSEDVAVLMWSHPRPLMLGAIPTMIRRLASGWRKNDIPGQDYQANHPLPDFIPSSLFDDLSLPEMHIALPDGLEPDDQYLPVQQGLGEFAPGKVSRRYDAALWLGVDGNVLGQWFANGAANVSQDAELTDWYDVDAQRGFAARNGAALIQFQAFRPRAARLARVPRAGAGVPELGDTSNAQLRWKSFLQAPHPGTTWPAPPHVGISKLIKHIVLYTHADQSNALVRRYAVGARAELRLRVGSQSERVGVDFHFKNNGEPSGIGFDIEVDAMVLVLDLPASLAQAINWSDPRRIRAARSARYNWEAKQDPTFCAALPNPFLRAWVAQVFQIASIQVSIAEGLPLSDAFDRVAEGVRMQELLGVLQTVFQIPEEDHGDDGADRLRQNLRDALRSPEVRLAARHAARVLVGPIDEEWNEWLSLSVRATLGAACLEAIQQACPQVDPDALVVDIEVERDDGSSPTFAEIWISEVNPGGNGLIESVGEVLASRPDALYRHIEAALGPRDFEWTNTQLREVVRWLGGDEPDPEITQAVLQVRQARGSTEAARDFAVLRALLVGRGQSIFHGYSVALSMRLLRPDSPPELDRLLAKIHQRWDQIETSHGLEIDVRVLCALFSNGDELDRAIESGGFMLPVENRPAWRFGVLMGLLWPQGHALRAVGMPWSSRFSPFAIDTERVLLEQWVTARPPAIDPSVPGWEDLVRERLLTQSRAVVSVLATQAAQLLPKVVATLCTEPVQFDYLNLFAQVAEIRRQGDRIEWTFAIPDPV